MAKNTQLNPGSGGDIAAADDIDGVKYQRIKLTLGADGVNNGDLSASNPLPVVGSLSVNNFPAQTALTDAQLRAAPVFVADEAVLANMNPLAAYVIHDVEDASPMLLGKSKTSGTWLLQRYTATGEMRYANASNNAGTTGYALAWADRQNLVYGTIDTLTGL